MFIHYHNGKDDFPHGAGASDPGYYVYENETDDEPSGPFDTYEDAQTFIDRRS